MVSSGFCGEGKRRFGEKRNGEPMGTLNVMQVTYSLDLGGAEIVLLNLVERMDRSRFRPMVCSFQRGGSLKPRFEALGVPVFEVEKKEGNDWRLYSKLARLFWRERVDVVHTHNSYMWLYAGPAGRWAGARVAHTEHSNIPKEKWKLKWASKGLARITGRIIADSKIVADFMIHETGLPEKKIQVIYNGVDAGRFEKKHDIAALRRSLGLAEEDRVVGTIARLVPVKNHAVLLDAFDRIAQRIKNVRLLIVGDGELRGEMEEKARRLGLQARVHFLGAREDIPDLLPVMDLFVLSSESEGLSIALLEAMAAGLPVVATRVGGTPELVIHGETGLLVRSGHPLELADAITRLLSQPALAAQYGRAGRERVRRFFNLKRMVSEYEGVYASVMGETHA